jgi:hypothetical protein
MLRAFSRYFVGSAAMLLCLCLAPSAPAQDKQQDKQSDGERKLKPLPKGGPTPRTPDGHPDLSGIWFPGNTGGFDVSFPAAQRQFDAKVTPQQKPVFQPWAEAKIKAMTAVDFELGRASVNCQPRGVPGMILLNPYPMQLVQTRGQLVQLNELNNNFRVIPTDGRAHHKDPDPTFNGDAVAHWDGDTLVIDVIGLDERTWNNFVGWFHSDQEHVIERLTRPDKNHLIYQVTIEDPTVLAKPWTSVPLAWSLGTEPLEEYFCTNNKEVDEYKVLKGQEAKDK